MKTAKVIQIPSKMSKSMEVPMIVCDYLISEWARYGMIEPFVPEQVRRHPDLDIPAISYGLSSYGYDIRLSPKEFKVFRHIPGTVVNPKRFNPDNLESVPLQSDDDGDYFIIPGNSYGLGVSLEKVVMPRNVTAICMGKSTYARAGLIANITPIEAGWGGHITLEFSNSAATDCRIYANEGVIQLVFFEGKPCKVPYSTRTEGGKYQGQAEQVTFARV